MDDTEASAGHKNNWFVVERPTDSGTVFVKKPPTGDKADVEQPEPELD